MCAALFNKFIDQLSNFPPSPFIRFLLDAELGIYDYYTNIGITVRSEGKPVLSLKVNEKLCGDIRYGRTSIGNIYESGYYIEQHNLPIQLIDLFKGNSCEECKKRYYDWHKDHDICSICKNYICRKHNKICCTVLK